MCTLRKGKFPAKGATLYANYLRQPAEWHILPHLIGRSIYTSHILWSMASNRRPHSRHFCVVTEMASLHSGEKMPPPIHPIRNQFHHCPGEHVCVCVCVCVMGQHIETQLYAGPIAAVWLNLAEIFPILLNAANYSAGVSFAANGRHCVAPHTLYGSFRRTRK